MPPLRPQTSRGAWRAGGRCTGCVYQEAGVTGAILESACPRDKLGPLILTPELQAGLHSVPSMCVSPELSLSFPSRTVGLTTSLSSLGSREGSVTSAHRA